MLVLANHIRIDLTLSENVLAARSMRLKEFIKGLHSYP